MIIFKIKTRSLFSVTKYTKFSVSCQSFCKICSYITECFVKWCITHVAKISSSIHPLFQEYTNVSARIFVNYYIFYTKALFNILSTSKNALVKWCITHVAKTSSSISPLFQEYPKLSARKYFCEIIYILYKSLNQHIIRLLYSCSFT